MIHARTDYNRFQEPRELMETIYFLCAAIQGKVEVSEEQSIEMLKVLNSKYKILKEGSTPIGEDEPVMVFRAQDKHFVPLLRAYEKLIKSDPKIKPNIVTAIEQHILLSEEWQLNHKTKTPDV